MRSKAIVACIAFVPFLMAASGPVRLQPSSPWDVDYAENSCRLIRLFGEGQNETILFFESGAPGEMDLLAVGKPLSTSAEQVAARFLPLGKATFNGDLAATTTKRDPSILWPNVPLVPDDLIDKFKKEHEARQLQTRVRPPPLDLAEVASDRAKRQQFAAQTTELEIQTRHKQTVILETGSLGEPMRMFEKCSSDSLKDWGVNPDLEDKIVRPVWPRNITSWFSANDYPKDMVARARKARLRYGCSSTRQAGSRSAPP